MHNNNQDDVGATVLAFELGQPSLIADAARKIITVNSAFLKLLDFPRDVLVGSALDELYVDQDDIGFLDFLQGDSNAIQEGVDAEDSYSGKTIRCTWDGRSLELVETITHVPTRGDQAVSYIVNCQEISGLIPKNIFAPDSERSFKQLIDSLPEAAVVLNGTTIDACNDQFARLVQRDKTDVAGKLYTDLSMALQSDGLDAVEKLQRIMTAVERGREGRLEWLLRLPNGEPRETEVSFSSFDYCGKKLTFANVRDITDRKRMEQERQFLLDELAQKEQMTRLATKAGGIAIWEVDLKTEHIIWSDGASDFFGCSVDELPSLFDELSRLVFHRDQELIEAVMLEIRQGHPFELETRFETKDGVMRWFRSQGQVECDFNDRPIIVRAAVSDISDYKNAQEEISRLAYYDPLTKLANRRLLMDRLSQYCSSVKRSNTSGVLFYLDLDRFKWLNDSLGHASGDILLIEVARRLLEVFRAEDTVARIGGDEFVVVVPAISGSIYSVAKKAGVIAEKLRETLAVDYSIDGREYHMSASIGLAIFPQDGDTAESVIQSADVAMYQAKKNGRNGVAFYRADLQDDADKRAIIEQDLRQAVSNKQFQLHYQPKVDESGKSVGVEALIRWYHPKRGLVPPVRFIGIAEETGLIIDIGQWVAEEACAQLNRWKNQGALGEGFSISINISPVQFRRKDFVSSIKDTLNRQSVAPVSLMLEITEGMLIEDIDETVEKLNELKELGVKVAIDDFGTGYSSLYYLKRLPLDEIKIDKAYVSNITNDRDDAAIVKTIMDLARHFGLKPVAEGVETQEQVAFLSDIGCRIYQGYFYAKPMSADDFSRRYLVPVTV